MVTYDNSCSIIVTYYPGDEIINSLLKQLKIFSKIIIVDNGSSKESLESITSISTANREIEFYKLYNNFGIGYALNIGIKRALDLKFKWLVTFDQDSVPDELLLSYYNRVLESLNDTFRVGLIGGAFSQNEIKIKPEVITWRKSMSLITSGTLYNSEIFKTVGYFNEQLFIDGVDFEFNLRARKLKFQTIKIDQPIIKHTLGDPIARKILGFNVISSNHSDTRRYFMARNHMIISKQYFYNFPLWIIKKNVYFIKSIVQLVLTEQNVQTKIKSICRGLRDGLVDRIGQPFKDFNETFI